MIVNSKYQSMALETEKQRWSLQEILLNGSFQMAIDVGDIAHVGQDYLFERLLG